MSTGDKNVIPDFNILLDGNGMPILPTENGILKRGGVSHMVINDDFATDDEIESATEGKDIPIGAHNGQIEEAGRSKLSKNGVNPASPVNATKHHNKPDNVVVQEKQKTNFDIEYTSIKHLIDTAEKSEQSITIDIKINAIDKGLFQVLNKSYKDKSEKILDIILTSNTDIIMNSIKKSIKKYYEE